MATSVLLVDSSEDDVGTLEVENDAAEVKVSVIVPKETPVEMVDSQPTPNKEPTTLVTPEVQTSGGSKTVFIGNIPFSVENTDVENFFKEVGGVVDVRFALHTDGSKKGFGHVEFVSADAAKKAVEEMNGKELMGCRLRLSLAMERKVYTPQIGDKWNSFLESEEGQGQSSDEEVPKQKKMKVATPVTPKVQTCEGSKTVFVGNLPYSAEKADMELFFKDVGEVVDVRFAIDSRGKKRDFSHVEFASAEAAKKAVEEMNGKEMMGRALRLDLAKERGNERNSFPKSEGGQGQRSDEEVQTCEGSKKVFVGNLPFYAEKADMKNFFKEVGEVVDVRLPVHPDGLRKCFGYIEFASADAAKKAVEEMNGKELMRRALRLDLVKEREESTPQSGDKRNSFPKSEGGQGQNSDEEVPKQKKIEVATPVPPKVETFEGSKTVFVGNLPYSVEKTYMKNVFKEVGEVVAVRLCMHPDGSMKGIGHIEFASADAAKKAVEKMNGKQILGRRLRLDLAKEREESTPQSGVKRNSFQKSEEGQGQSSDEEMSKQKKMKIQLNDAKMVNSEPTPRKKPAIPVPPKVQTFEGSNTVFCANLPFSVEKADVILFFKEVGEVVDVRFAMYTDGSKKGFGHVEFASADAAKKAVEEMNGKELMGRALRLDLAKEREEHAPQSGDKRNLFPKSEGGQGQNSDEEVPKQKKMEVATPVTPKVQTCEGSKTVFAWNLPYSVEKADMKNFFKEVGEVVDVRLPMHPDGLRKCFGYIEFASADAAKKAVEKMNGKEIMGRVLRLDLAKEKSAGGEALTIFIRGLDINDDVFKIKEGLKEHFGSCGEITRVHVATGPEGCVTGTAYMDFIDNDAFNKALELHLSQFDGSFLLVEVAKPKIDSNAGGGRGGRRR